MLIEFDTDNAAFREEEDGALFVSEVARVLRLIASEVENGYDSNTVKDQNGNKVGRWTV